MEELKAEQQMKALSLFSGIGGLDLAAQMAGIEVAAFCEIEPFIGIAKAMAEQWTNERK